MFNKYFLIFLLGLIALVLYGIIFPANTGYVEIIGDVIKCIATGMCAIGWWFRYKTKSYTALKCTAWFFAYSVFAVLAGIQTYKAIILGGTNDFLIISAFDYGMLILCLGQYLDFKGHK